MEVVNCLADGEGGNECADASDGHKHTGFNSIPWLAVKFTPGLASGTVSYGGEVIFTIEEWTSGLGLWMASAKDLGIGEFVAGGKYTVTINGVASTIEVPAE